MLIASAAALFIVVGIVTALLSGPAREDLTVGDLALVLLAIIVRAAADALYTGFTVGLVADSRAGRAVSVGRLFSSAAHVIPALIVMSIVLGVAVGIGLLILVVPGLVLVTIWAVAAPAIVVEGAGPIEALGRSRRLVRGDGWPVFLTIVVVFLISAVITSIFGAAGNAVSGAGYGVAVSIAAFLTAPIHSLAAGVMFFDLGGSRPEPASGVTET